MIENLPLDRTAVKGHRLFQRKGFKMPPRSLPIYTGLASQREKPDPRGVCGTCRFFIDDVKEVDAEMRLLSQGGVVSLRTSERLTDAEGRERFGEGVGRTFTQYKDDAASGHVAMFAALTHRLNVDPAGWGLCEKGGPGEPARLVHRNAGWTADENGWRIDQCPIWQSYSRLETLLGRRVRARDWKERREKALHLRARPALVFQECPWHPGRDFKTCCGKRS